MASVNQETTPVEVEELAATEKAYLFYFVSADKNAWIPKSCVPSRHFPNADSKTHIATIFDWILKKHDII